MDKATIPNYNEAGETFVQSTRTLFTQNRDYLTKAINEMALPWKPVFCQGGYFLMADITACKDLIPDKFKATHDYED